MGAMNKLKESGSILHILGVIGIIGIVMLIIYGNLSGNLGFGQDSATTALQQFVLDNGSAVTFTGTTGKVNPSVSNVVLINATGGETIGAGNYTLTATTIIGNGATPYNGTNVNASYITSYDSQGKINTDNVITNITGGYGTFFGFSNTLFTIAAVVLLITMLVGLLYVVMALSKRNKGTNYS